MSNTIAYVDNQTLTNIANAVRYKTGTNEKMLLSDIPDKIRNIEGIVPTGTQVITENGEYDVVGDRSVTVDVNPDLRPLSVSENGTYQPDGFDGFSQVSVDTGIKCVTGKFEVKRDISWGEALEVSIPHNLGTVPSMIVIWTHTYDETKPGLSTPVSVWVDKDELALPWGEAALNPYVIRFAVPSTGATNLIIGGPTHNITGLKYKPTATEFHLIESSAYKSYLPGIYYYLLVAGGWESYANNHMSDDDIYVVN